MSPSDSQELVVVTVRGIDLAAAADQLRREIADRPGSRIVALTQQTNVLTALHGRTTLLAAVEKPDPSTPE